MKKHIYLAVILTLIFSSCSTEEPIPTYTLAVSVSPAEAGKIIISPQSPNYKEGEMVTLTAEPNENWVFENWGGDGSGSSTPLQITMTANKSVVGNFVRNQTVTALNCSAATNNGTITSGVAVTGVVNIVIPYSGAFGGTHNGQAVNSTGVTGLTATLAAGTFANGAGNLTYIITGTPSAVGTASFAINIGGKTCNINRTVTVALAPGEVMSITGKIWMDRNLGASRVATSINDVESYGDLYQWGRGADGHQKRNSPTSNALSSSNVPGNGNFILNRDFGPGDWRSPRNDNLWQGVNGVNNPCPTGYRIPTEVEWYAEYASWGTTNGNAAGAFASPLKLPMAGSRNRESGSLRDVNTYGYYWSSTVNSTRVGESGFFANGILPSTNSVGYRANGFSVRCIKD